MKTKEDKKELILKAAINIFSKKGFHNTTMDDIASEASLAKGTLYWHFKTKEELYFSLGLEQKMLIDKIFTSAFMSDIPPLEKIQKILESIITYFIESKTLNGLTLNIFGQGPNTFKGNIAQEIQNHFENYRSIFADIIKKGINDGTIKNDEPDQLASIITSLLVGVMFQSYLYPESIKQETFTKTMNNFITSALKK